MSEAFALDASPSEARWYVEIVIGRKIERVARYGPDRTYSRPADVPTETSSIDGYSAQESRPTREQLGDLVPEGWKRLESTVTEIKH